MERPWTYRPSSSDQPDWSDNALSNCMAWASDTFVPRWCKDEGHWTFAVIKPGGEGPDIQPSLGRKRVEVVVFNPRAAGSFCDRHDVGRGR